MLIVEERLAANEKIIFIANLFENVFSDGLSEKNVLERARKDLANKIYKNNFGTCLSDNSRTEDKGKYHYVSLCKFIGF